MHAVVRASLAAMLALLVAAPLAAQEPKSAALAKQLAAALDGAKLDSIAAKDPSSPDVFVAAFYFPGVQMLVVSAKYTAPSLLSEKLDKKEYKEVYIDLNSASVPDSKIFITDLGADGLKADNQPYDTYEVAGKPLVLDGDYKKQKLSKEDYQKGFAAADERYSQILTTLLAQLKKTS
jgi:hypothetical protein